MFSNKCLSIIFLNLLNKYVITKYIVRVTTKNTENNQFK